MKQATLPALHVHKQAANAFAYLPRHAVEHYDAIVADKDGRPLAVVGSFKGALTQTSVYPGTVVGELSRIDGAAHVWAAHNHPSGLAILSSADRNLDGIFARTLDGSGIEYHGLFAMANKPGSPGVVAYDHTSYGSGEVERNLPTPFRVPIVDRELIDERGRQDGISSPTMAKSVVAGIAGRTPGIVFSDAQNRPVAFVPFTGEELGRLKVNGRLMRLFRSASQANAGGAFIAMPDGKVTKEQVANVYTALAGIDVRVIDGIEYSSDGTGEARSLASDGELSGAGLVFSRGPATAGQTVEAVRAEIADSIGAGRLARLERAGLVRIHESVATLPEDARQFPDAWGWFDGRVIHLVAGNIAPGQAAGAFQHEAWHRMLLALRMQQSPLRRKLMTRLAQLEANGAAVAWFEEANAAIPATDRADRDTRLNELAAYAIQQHERAPGSLPELIRCWARDMIAAVRAFFMERLGWVPEGLTLADLSALTRRYLRALADERTDGGAIGLNPAVTNASYSRPAGAAPLPPPIANAWQRAKAKAAEILSPKNLDKVIYELQDKFIDLKRLRDHIRAIGGTITGMNDAYLGEDLYHQRLAHRTQDFLKAELRPLLADMRARGVGIQDLETFLHARHAPEANSEMAKRNPNQSEIDAGRQQAAATVRRLERRLQHAQARGLATAALESSLNDARGELVRWNGAQAFHGTEEERKSLSGLSDAAAAIMNGLTPERRADLDALAARVDAINEGTLQLLQD